jgi:hypothetical protein
VPGATDPDRRPPAAAIAAAVLALPSAYAVLALGNAALVLAGARDGGGGAASWLVLLITLGWAVGMLVGAVRLLLGRAWLAVAVCAACVAGLLTVGVVLGGFGGSGLFFTGSAWLVSVATAVLASLPGVRHWIARRRRNRLFPGSAQRSPSRP